MPRRVVKLLMGIALVQSALIAHLLTTARAVPDAGRVVVLVESTRSGDVVTVDGREVGTTPHRLEVTPSMQTIGLTGAPPPSTADTRTATAPDPVGESPIGVPAAEPGGPRGGLILSSPIELHVLEGDRVLGSSADGPIVTAEGTHQLDLVNSALGFRERRTVEVVASQMTMVTVEPQGGRLNVNAVPWAQIWIDGRPAGETPLANVSLPIGPHELVFRHPELGERRETAMVRSGALTRVSVNFSAP